MEVLYANLMTIEANMVIMWAIGGVLIYLAIAKGIEPMLLLPIMGTGMLGIFLVTGMIIASINLRNQLTFK